MRPVLLASLAGKALALALLPYSGAAALIVWFGPDLVVIYHLVRPQAQGLGRVFTRFDTPRREVWLTIDDGPDPDDTPRILELLDRHGARATFFVIGQRVRQAPELAAAIVQRGHELANHTDTHPLATFWCASRKRLHAEIAGCAAALGELNARVRWFRPPAGVKNLRLHAVLAERGLQCVGWSARGLDGVRHDPDAIANRILARVKPGAVILMHEGARVSPGVRVVALERLLHRLTSLGYSCVIPRLEQLR